MENKESRKIFDQGSAVVMVDSKRVTAGQRVTGKVSVQLIESYPSDKIILQLVGKLKVLFEGDDSEFYDRKHDNRVTIRKNLILLSQVLETFPDKNVPKGTRKYPFAFDIPINLPSSFIYTGELKSLFRITYKVVARIEDCS